MLGHREDLARGVREDIAGGKEVRQALCVEEAQARVEYLPCLLYARHPAHEPSGFTNSKGRVGLGGPVVLTERDDLGVSHLWHHQACLHD